MPKRFFLVSLLFLMSFFSVQAQGLIWQRTYGDTPFNYTQGLIKLNGDQYMLLVNESSGAGNGSVHLLKIDSLGEVLGNYKIGDSVLRQAQDFKRTSDGGYIIAGQAFTSMAKGYDFMLIKTDAAGQVIWEKYFGGNDWDMASAVVETPDNGFMVAGKTYSYGAGDADIYLVKCNDTGDTLWTRVMGGDSLDYASALSVTAGNTCLLAANTGSFGKGSMDAWIMEFSLNGDTVWSGFFGDSLEDRVNAIMATPDKGFVFAGFTRNYNALNTEVWLYRADSGFNYMWKMPEAWTIGPGNDVATNVSLNDSAQFIVSGYTDGIGMGGDEMSILIMGEFYHFRYSNTFGSLENDRAVGVVQCSDRGYLIAGNTYGAGPSHANIFVVKTAPDCLSDTMPVHTSGVEDLPVVSRKEVLIFPNPASAEIHINLAVSPDGGEVMLLLYQTDGKLLYKTVLPASPGQQAVTATLPNLKNGIYLAEIRSSNLRSVQKLLIRQP